jgi:toxin ParE1/3/4
MNKKRKTIVQPEVYTEAEAIYEYIKENSPQNAEKFKEELLNQIDKVESNPEGYPSESFLNTTKILYRFTLILKKWKLIFKVSKDLLIFIGIIHTSRNPQEIQKLKNDNSVE